MSSTRPMALTTRIVQLPRTARPAQRRPATRHRREVISRLVPRVHQAMVFANPVGWSTVDLLILLVGVQGLPEPQRDPLPRREPDITQRDRATEGHHRANTSRVARPFVSPTSGLARAQQLLSNCLARMTLGIHSTTKSDSQIVLKHQSNLDRKFVRFAHFCWSEVSTGYDKWRNRAARLYKLSYPEGTKRE